MGATLAGERKSFQAGRPIFAIDLNRLADGDWQNQSANPAPFTYGGRFPGGSLVIPIPSPPAAGTPSVSVKPPWFPFYTNDPITGDFQGNFIPGTIGGLLASNLFTALTLDQTQANYVWAAMTATAGVVTGATLTVNTTYPTLAASTSGSAPTAFNVPIGIFDPSQSPATFFNIVGFGNIWCQPYVTELDTIGTGALLTAPFTPSYNWEWGAGN